MNGDLLQQYAEHEQKKNDKGLIMCNGSLMSISVDEIKINDAAPQILLADAQGGSVHGAGNTEAEVTVTGKLKILYSEEEMDDVLDQMGRSASVPEDYEDLVTENRQLNEELAKLTTELSWLRVPEDQRR